MKLNTIYNEDNLETMRRMTKTNVKVDLTITSPPYDDMRTFSGNYEFNYKRTAVLLYHVTAEGGVVVWVVGDTSKDGDESGTSFKHALYFKDIGFNLHDTMIYQKKGMSSIGSNKAYYQGFEYMFVFTKGKIKTFNPIIDVKNRWAGTSTFGVTTIRQKDGSLKKAQGKRVINDMSKRSNIWTYAPGHDSITGDKEIREHPAVFPEKLAHDHIISWSNENDLIYDPFMGSGTVAKVARNTNRNFIGSEINPEYCKIAQKRLNKADLFHSGEMDYITQMKT